MVLDLNLDAFSRSREMPIALSIKHWQAQVDGMDTEFVLGSVVAAVSDRRRLYATAPRAATVPAPREVYPLDFTKRATHL